MTWMPAGALGTVIVLCMTKQITYFLQNVLKILKFFPQCDCSVDYNDLQISHCGPLCQLLIRIHVVPTNKVYADIFKGSPTPKVWSSKILLLISCSKTIEEMNFPCTYWPE